MQSRACEIVVVDASQAANERADFARIAQELSVTPAELDTFVRRGPHASDELPRLLKSIGIDEATLSRTQPLLQRDMIRVCDRDLDAGSVAQHYEEYCPNAPSIDALGKQP